MPWRKGFLSIRKIDEAPQSIDDLWLDLGYLVRQRPIRGLAGPGKKNPGIHSIEITLKRARKFVRLEPSNHAYQKVLNANWISSHAFDDVRIAVPSLEPKFIVLSSRIAAHIQEERCQFIRQQQHSLGSCLQQNTQPLNGDIGNE